MEKTEDTEGITPEAPVYTSQPIIFSQAPPTQHWKICQQIIRSWGGDLQFNQPEIGNSSTRLLLVATQ